MKSNYLLVTAAFFIVVFSSWIWKNKYTNHRFQVLGKIDTKVPDSSRYTRIVLAEGLDEPMEMAVLPNLNVLFVERKGAVKLYNSKTKAVKTIANINVFS